MCYAIFSLFYFLYFSFHFDIRSVFPHILLLCCTNSILNFLLNIAVLLYFLSLKRNLAQFSFFPFAFFGNF